MSRKREKVFSEMFQYLEQNSDENPDEEKINSLVQNFIKEHGVGYMDEITEETARTSDDYLDLAEAAEDEVSALRYAKKALKLDPDNLDAEIFIASLTAKDTVDYLKKMERVIIHGDKLMKEMGYTENEYIGAYWEIIETRPYMRGRMEYMMALKECGMLRKAAAECEEIIRLNNNDNMGIRFTLMSLYALLEEEKPALELQKRYGEYDETQMLLGLSLLYFKLGKLSKSLSYLKRLAKINKDTLTFFEAILEDDVEQYIDEMSDFGYQLNTIQELIVAFMENPALYMHTVQYVPWACNQLKKKK